MIPSKSSIPMKKVNSDLTHTRDSPCVAQWLLMCFAGVFLRAFPDGRSGMLTHVNPWNYQVYSQHLLLHTSFNWHLLMIEFCMGLYMLTKT